MRDNWKWKDIEEHVAPQGKQEGYISLLITEEVTKS